MIPINTVMHQKCTIMKSGWPPSILTWLHVSPHHSCAVRWAPLMWSLLPCSACGGAASASDCPRGRLRRWVWLQSFYCSMGHDSAGTSRGKTFCEWGRQVHAPPVMRSTVGGWRGWHTLNHRVWGEAYLCQQNNECFIKVPRKNKCRAATVHQPQSYSFCIWRSILKDVESNTDTLRSGRPQTQNIKPLRPETLQM